MQSGILNQRQSSQGETQDTGTDSVLHYEIGQSSNFDVLNCVRAAGEFLTIPGSLHIYVHMNLLAR